jgi:hypothetical protein
VERQKKFGSIAIASSLVLAIASLVFSENLCYAGTLGDSWLNMLLICLRINVYEEIPGNSFADHIYIPTKYVLLACAAVLAVGILWLKGALPVPSEKAKTESVNPSTATADDA